MNNALGSVVMPLVRLLSRGELSWADRQEVSCAIAACAHHFSCMESETRAQTDADLGRITKVVPGELHSALGRAVLQRGAG
jgi:hypothetical protein